MSGQIFISYRHDDDATQAAGGLYDWLRARFPQNEIFLDDDKTNPGIDYAAVIESNVAPSDVVVIVIGKRWLSSADEQGRRRLDQPGDFVRLETGIALRRGIAIIPVLVDGALMAGPDELPEDLKGLVRRQAFVVSEERFRADAERLAGAVAQALGSARTEPQREQAEQARIDSKRRDREGKGRLEPPWCDEEGRQIPAAEAERYTGMPEQPVEVAEGERQVPEGADAGSPILWPIEESPKQFYESLEAPAVADEAAGTSRSSEGAEPPARAFNASHQMPLKTGGANCRHSGRPLVVAGTGVAVCLLGVGVLFNASRHHPKSSRPQSVAGGRKSMPVPPAPTPPAAVAVAPNAPIRMPLVKAALPSPTASARQVLTSPTPPSPSVTGWLAEAERCLDAKDYAQARQWFQKAADAGDASARQRLSMLGPPSVSQASPPSPVVAPSPADALTEAKRYLDTKDYVQALPLLRKAAETGNAEALNQLGELYYNGRGVTQGYAQARQWYLQAAMAGNSNGMYRLGELYQYGQGVARDYAQARRWYQAAVDAGNTDGMNGLGRLYENGRGVPRDYTQARQWYQKAVDAGNVQGMVNLGSLYEGSAAQYYALARQWYQKAADAGNSNAMYHLGLLYQYGLSVPRDYAQAREWYQKTVDAGNPQGMVNLGSLYEDGLGVPQDYAQARQWYQKAADAGHPGGMNGLGRLYENGRGVPQDYAQARHWYQKAVEAGSVAAMEHLGNMYYYGHGVAQDHTKAREWYQKAVDGGWPVVLLPKN